MRRRNRNVSRYAPIRTCWPLSTRSPVEGSTNADARPPGEGRASSTRTRTPFSARAVAALRPANPAPMTMTSLVNDSAARLLPCLHPVFRSSNSEQCLEPQAQGDHRALRPRHPDPRAENIVAPALDALQDLEVDAAHDLGRHETARILRRQVVGRAAIVVVRPLALEAKQIDDWWRQEAGPEVALLHAEPLEIFARQVDPAAHDVSADIADDVGQLQGQTEVFSIGPGSIVAISEDLEADQTDRGRHTPAILGERGKGVVAGVAEIHFHTVEQRLEWCAGQPELPDVRLKALPLERPWGSFVCRGELGTPARQPLGRACAYLVV